MTRKRHFVKHIFVLLLAAVLLLGTITAAQAASAILTKQPMDASTVGTGTVNFTVDASGSNLTYRWQYKAPAGSWKNCSSATQGYNTNTLTVAGISNGTNRDGYQYRCVVTSGSTKLTSNAATLTVYAIKTQPESATVDAGETAEFRVAATGSDLSYQWQYRTPNGSWKNCSSATKGYNTDTLTVESINGKTSRDGYHYRCVVTSGDVKLTSKAAKLTVAGPVIEITSQPQDAQTVGANKVSFTVKASGNDLSYQWQYLKPGGSWKNCSSATQGYNTDTLTVAGISGSTNRNGYQYRCVITSGIENLASDAATLTVTVPAPTVEITVQPKDARAEGENKVSFTVKASGSDLSYQWQYKKPGGNWKNCSSATQGYNTDTLTVAGISGATNRNGYQYRCVVSSGSEMETSKAATLTVTQPVSVIEITSQPQDAVGKGGDTAVFRIKAVGEGLTYQWQYSTDNGESWINASSTGTSTSCKINKTSNGRLYRCVITDSYGTQAISDAASLTWIAPISIVGQPEDAYVPAGAEAVFSVELQGAENWELIYLWQASTDSGETWTEADGAVWISDDGNQTTVTTGVDESTYGRMYRCVITDETGAVFVSKSAKVMESGIRILEQPQDALGEKDEYAVFKVAASGAGLTYQWQYSDDEGETWVDASSTKTSISCKINGTSNGRLYRCVLTDSSGAQAVTREARLIWQRPLSIVKQPSDDYVQRGGEAIFTVQAVGWNLSYDWEYSEDNGETWLPASGTNATFHCAADDAAAARQYRCVVTNGDGEQQTTRSVRVYLTDLSITSQPEDAMGKTGDIATFTVTAEGYGLSYQWQYSTDGGETWTDSAAKASVTCTINRTSNGRQYRCIITDKYGQTVISDTASITWIAPITIVKQPADVSVLSGDEVTFTVQAEGWNLSYSWEYSEDGGEAWNETGCTDETFSFEADEAAAARQYRCVITDGTGEQKITRVTKVTLSDLQILTQPQDALGETGDIASFKVTANGVGLTYQWQYSEDGGETWVNSATKQTATCTINRTSNGRLYRCIVTDSYGKTAISNTASVIWMPPLKIVKQPVDAYGSSGSTVEFTVKAEGWNLSYSWEYSADDGVTWTPADCTEATISCTVDDTTVGRRFRCIVTDGQGNSLPSSSAQICSSAIVIDPETGLAYYIVDGNVKLTGWQRMEDGTRYFDDSGSMARGVSTVNGKKYYFDWNTGLQRFGLIDVGAGHYMYFDETTGNPVSGLKTVDGVTYYFSAESGLSQGGFETVGDSTYYFDRETYRMVTGMLRLDDKVFYFGEDGKMLTGLIETDDGAYYARDTGTLYSGTFVADGKRYCADDETYKLFTGFYETGGTRYYFDGVNGAGNGLTWIDGKLYNFRSDGSIKTGLLTVDGTRYFFDLETGEAVFGLVSYGGRIYGLTENGVQTGLTFMDGALYDFSSSGYAYLGLQTIDGDKYYFDTTTGQACNGWKTINGIRYYFEDYKAVCGQTREIDGVSYTFTSSGAMKNPNKNSGCVTENGVKMYYDPESGERQLGFVTLDGNTFYYTENGLATGLLELEDGVWYFDNSCVMRKGLQKIGDNVYYFDLETGRRCSGLVTTTEKPVYADPETGVLQSGFVEIDGKEYYFRPNVFTAQTGWLTLDSTRYYFDAQGVRRTGFVTVGDYTYYVDESGTRTGLSEINGSTYCFSNSGYLLYGARTIDDKAYYFDTKTGAMRTGLVELNGKWYGYLPEGGLAAGYHDFDGKTYFFTEMNNQLVLGLYSDKDGNLFNFDLERGLVKNDDWIWEGVSFHADSAGKVSVTVDESNPFSKLMARGVELLGTPYGKNEGQLVCSSLVYTVMQAVDVDIPETVNRQYTKLMSDNTVDKDFSVDALQKGDAVFYLNGKCGISDCHEINEIHHVGIYLGGGKMLEATSLYYNDELEDKEGYTLIRDITNSDDIFVVMVAHLM